MTSKEPLSLRSRLLAVAEQWSAATGRSIGALSTVVSNHGSTLARLRDPAKTVTDATLENFARFLVDPANWPDGQVSEEALGLAHVTGVSACGAAVSAGKGGDLSTDPAEGPLDGVAA